MFTSFVITQNLLILNATQLYRAKLYYGISLNASLEFSLFQVIIPKWNHIIFCIFTCNFAKKYVHRFYWWSRHLFRRFYFEFYREAVPRMHTPGKRHYYSCDIYIILKIIESKSLILRMPHDLNCWSPSKILSDFLISCCDFFLWS